MRWHQGTIPDAINQAKLKQAIFLVFVSGNDEQSQKMSETLEDLGISAKLEENCVALKLEANSESAKQFSQIYPVVVVPSTFFIGSNGVPLEVIGGSLDSNQLGEKINKAVELHGQNISVERSSSGFLSSDSHRSVPSSTVAGAAMTLPSSENAAAVKSTQPVTTTSFEQPHVLSDVNSSAAAVQQSVSLPSQNLDATNESRIAALEERVERAKQLALQLKEQKRIEEEEKEKLKEMERRKLGRNLQKNKQKQQEQEVKQLADEIAREKAEERAAREKIRQQIALDRAERATKYNAVKAEEERQKQEVLQAKLKIEQERAAVEAANRSIYARLQFRLPDGSSMNHQFDAGASLQTVLDFVKEAVKPPFSPFHLSLAFPRRVFQENDYSLSLRDLQLAPTASILVLPVRSSAVQSSQKFDNFNFVWLLLSPFLTIWRMLQTFLFGTPSPSIPNQAGRSSSGTTSQAESSTAGSRTNVVPPRNSQSSDSKIFGRREGNIYRLPNPNGEDDDNNTWNGNSTQQQ